MIPVSVIVPARDAATTLPACLASMAAQIGEGDEILVVDDASTDPTPAVVSAYPARLIRLREGRGPAAARNAGAGVARGAVLLFLDADVVLAPGGLERVRAAFADRMLDALIGSYDDEPSERSTVSLFKNLSHHYFHQRSAGEAVTFWGACGAIRREVFTAAGGFDAERFSLPSIEDVELGYRLVESGRRIRLDPDLRVRHLKRWTLRSLVATDVARRAIPWTRLALERGGLPSGLNFGPGQRIAAVVALALAATAPSSLVWPRALVLLPVFLVAAVWLNRDLYALFARKGGGRLVLGGFLLQQLYYLYSMAGAGIGLALHLGAPHAPRPALR